MMKRLLPLCFLSITVLSCKKQTKCWECETNFINIKAGTYTQSSTMVCDKTEYEIRQYEGSPSPYFIKKDGETDTYTTCKLNK